jgi:hypothetical protein
MRTAIAWLGIVLLPGWAAADHEEKFYYLGEVKLSSATGQPMGSQVIVFEKIHDPDRSMMIERAIVVQADGKAQ